jgi:hypothetical protein
VCGLPLDERMALDAIDQVGGHRFAQPLAADDHQHARAGVGQVEDSLPGRVAGADHHDVVSAAVGRFASAGAAGHLRTADSVREPEEVLDQRRVRGLPPGNIALEHVVTVHHDRQRRFRHTQLTQQPLGLRRARLEPLVWTGPFA